MKPIATLTVDELKQIAATAKDDEYIYISDFSRVRSTGKSLMGKTTQAHETKGCSRVNDDYGNNYPKWAQFSWEVMNVEYINSRSDEMLESALDEKIRRLEYFTGRKRA